tara:strand:- start:13974 stop:14495 length:522 start_codon:yes stop_codon:yes gene_type:complete
MRNALILTLIGPDKPGLVEMVSATLSAHEANWQQSSMSRLAGKFAGILKANVDSRRLSTLTRSLNELESSGLRVIVETDQGENSTQSGQQVTLALIGHDKSGIVHEISRILVSQGVSIEQFESSVMSGPMSAEPLFKADAKLCVPATIDLDQLQSTLESIAVNLMVDISFKEV